MPKLIHKYVQPRSIAYWYMHDGAQKWKDRSKGVRFCTHNFTLLDVQHLARVLQTRYALKVSLQKNGLEECLCFSTRKKLSHLCELLLIPLQLCSSKKEMKQLIYPYLIESMRYKFPTLEAG